MNNSIDTNETKLFPIIDYKIFKRRDVRLCRDPPEANPIMVINFDSLSTPGTDPLNLVKSDQSKYGIPGSWYFTTPEKGKYNITASINLSGPIGDKFRAMLYMTVDLVDNMLNPHLPTCIPPELYILQILGEPGWYTPPRTLQYIGSRLITLDVSQRVDIRLYLNSNRSDKYFFYDGYVRILKASR